MSNTNTDTTTAKAVRKPRAKKVDETTAVTAASAAAVTAATLGLCVLVTLPPLWKVEDPNARPYWQIEIRDQQGQRYSNVYRLKELEKARALAEKIASDRKLPIVTQEPPAPRRAEPEAEPVPMPDPEEDAAEGEATPF